MHVSARYRTKFIEYPPWPFGSNLKLSVDKPKFPAAKVSIRGAILIQGNTLPRMLFPSPFNLSTISSVSRF